jgi:hypothetical protein
MPLSCGIVGLPNAGKSTIFNALTAAGAQVANYPFCTIQPQVGIVQVPDERLFNLASLLSPPKVVPASMEFVDIAGLVKGASQGEGLGNQFLGYIRQVDAIAHVVRCFESTDVAHPTGQPDPKQDMEIVNTELMLADLETLQARIHKHQRQAKSGDKHAREQLELYRQVMEGLQQGIRVKCLNLSAEQLASLADLHLLSTKPVIYVANVGEEGTPDERRLEKMVVQLAEAEGTPALSLSGRLEAELAELDPKEQQEFQRELGLAARGIERLIKACYKLLGLITFFTTTGGKEIRAWPIKQGSSAHQAAGLVHTDMMRGFIRAEVIHYNDFISTGSEQAARDKGLLHVEGREYVVQDGDILHIRFQV